MDVAFSDAGLLQEFVHTETGGWRVRPLEVPRVGHRNGGFPKLGVLFGRYHNKDYSILGSILGSPYVGKLPNHMRIFPGSTRMGDYMAMVAGFV